MLLCLLLRSAILLRVVVHYQDLSAGVLLYELLHRHLDEHVIIYFVRAASFKLSGYPTIDGCLVDLLLLTSTATDLNSLGLRLALVFYRFVPLLGVLVLQFRVLGRVRLSILHAVQVSDITGQSD